MGKKVKKIFGGDKKKSSSSTPAPVVVQAAEDVGGEGEEEIAEAGALTDLKKKKASASYVGEGALKQTLGGV